tara:strand:+ start:17949 stop:20036 length:2088 start_codon:yes stop_codon:yes gene_type:complete
MKKILLIIFLLVGFLSTSQGAKITSDLLKLGKPGSANDKILKLGGTREIRSNETSGLLEFSNDGALYKKLGSGSGSGGSGGVNILLNSSFEDGLTNWTNSGGTFTQETYTNAVEGNEKYARFVASAVGQYIETDLTTFADNLSGGGMADFKYTQGDNVFEYKVIEGATEIASGTLSDLTTWLKAPTLTFTIGAATKLRIISTAAGTIDVDEGYLGSNKNIAPVGPSSSFWGSVKWQGAANCQFTQSVSAAWQNFNNDLDCDNDVRTIKGFYNTTDGSIGHVHGQQPIIKFSKMKKGTYRVIAKGAFLDQNASQICLFRFSDAMTNSSISSVYAATAGIRVPSIEGEFHYTEDQTDVIIGLQANNQNSFTCEIENSVAREFEISVYYYPDSSETVEAFTPESADFFVKAKLITGDTTITTTSFDFVSSPSMSVIQLGGSPIRAMCSDGSIGGVTCSTGNEIYGISVDIPRAGKYKYCVEHSMANTVTAFHSTNTQLVTVDPTAPGTPIITGEGETVTTINVGAREQTRKCETFQIDSVGPLGFLAEMKVSAGTTTIYTDTFSYVMTLEMVEHNVSRPYLTGNQVTTPGAINMKSFSAIITPTDGTTCTISNQKGNTISSTTPTAIGDCTVNFTGLSSVPNCSIETNGYVGVVAEAFTHRIALATASTLRFYHQYQSAFNNPRVLTAVPIMIKCHGD